MLTSYTEFIRQHWQFNITPYLFNFHKQIVSIHMTSNKEKIILDLNSNMADQQKIHPVDVETSPLPTAPLVPEGLLRSDKGYPADQQYPPYQRTIPVAAPLRPPKRKRSCLCKCCCWSILSIVILTVLIAATVGILYLVFDPKVPKYSVDRLRVTTFDIDTNLIAHAAFSLTVTARNTNKHIGIYYEDGSRLSVWYSGSSLCSGSFPVFYQGHRNTSLVTVDLTGEAQLGTALMAVLEQQQQTGSVPLEFRGNVPVRVKFGGLKLRKMTAKVRCDLVVDSLSTNNQISIKTSNCKFKGLKF